MVYLCFLSAQKAAMPMTTATATTAAIIATSVVMNGASAACVSSAAVGSIGSGVVGSIGSGATSSNCVDVGVVNSGSIDAEGDGASTTAMAVSAYEP